jgi:drug/metabolite transporter (DMT)-like permease
VAATLCWRAAVAIAVFGYIVLSLNGVIARQVEAALDFQIVFWRAVGLLAGVTTVFCVRHGRTAWDRLRSNLMRYAAAAPLQGFGSTLFIIALTHTSVANTMLLLSATPLFATVLAWAFLREPAGRSTCLAIAATTAGIALMAADGLATGTLLGNAAALANALTFSVFILLLRRGRGADMLPAVAMGAVIAAVTAASAADAFAISVHDAALCFAWGALIQCTGLALITYASRALSVSELSLISMAEFVFAPILAWAVVDETPCRLSIAGGALVIGAVGLWSLRRFFSSRSNEVHEGQRRELAGAVLD